MSMPHPKYTHTLADRNDREHLRILSGTDWEHWHHEGYVVVKGAVPKHQIDNLVNLIWEFEEKNPDDPETWYAKDPAQIEMDELNYSGMVEIYNHQYLWDNRQSPKIHQAFADVWGTEKLWVTIDRANLNLPVRPWFQFKGFIHWDMDPEYDPDNVQGVLALNDQTEDKQGGFQCIPELYRTYDTWKHHQPADRDRTKPDISGFELVNVKLQAGDLLIFNSRLPHGIRPNRSGYQVRMAQYISMFPAEPENTELLEWRIQSWKHRIAPTGKAFPGDPRNWEQDLYPRAELNTLGEKLLGIKPW